MATTAADIDSKEEQDTNENQDIADNVTYPCCLCSEFFFHLELLIAHMNTHLPVGRTTSTDHSLPVSKELDCAAKEDENERIEDSKEFEQAKIGASKTDIISTGNLNSSDPVRKSRHQETKRPELIDFKLLISKASDVKSTERTDNVAGSSDPIRRSHRQKTKRPAMLDFEREMNKSNVKSTDNEENEAYYSDESGKKLMHEVSGSTVKANNAGLSESDNIRRSKRQVSKQPKLDFKIIKNEASEMNSTENEAYPSDETLLVSPIARKRPELINTGEFKSEALESKSTEKTDNVDSSYNPVRRSLRPKTPKLIDFPMIKQEKRQVKSTENLEHGSYPDKINKNQSLERKRPELIDIGEIRSGSSHSNSTNHAKRGANVTDRWGAKTKGFAGHTCIECGEECLNKKSLNQHIDQVHNGIIYTCKKCDESFSQSIHINHHMRSFHPPELEMVEGEASNIGSISDSESSSTEAGNVDGQSTKQNQSNKGKENSKFYTCKECGENCSTRNILFRHMKKHTGIQYSCKRCGYSSSRCDYLKFHVRNVKCGELKNSSNLDMTNSIVEHSSDEVLNDSVNDEHENFDELPDKSIDNTRISSDVSLLISSHNTSTSERGVVSADDTFRSKSKSPKCSSKPKKKNKSARHVCEICGNEYASRGILLRHIKQHQGNQYSCPRCSKSFSRSDYCKDHMRNVQCRAVNESDLSINDNAVNDICSDNDNIQIYINEAIYDASKKSSEVAIVSDADSREEENSCDSESKSRQQSSAIIYKCSQCGETFQTQKDCRSHIQVTHPIYFKEKEKLSLRQNMCSANGRHICKWCGMQYKWKSNLTRHVNTEHEKEREYVCHRCSKSFSRPDYLTDHLNSKKCSGEGISRVRNNKRYVLSSPCTICGKLIMQGEHMRKHLRYHKNGFPKCDICDKEMSSESKLTLHKRIIHMGMNSVMCHICGFVLRWADDLNRHLRTHEDKSTRKKYACENCDKVFFLPGSLKRHTEKHHSVYLGASYPCTKCGKLFSSLRNVARHEYTCEFKDKFLCGICQLTCVTKSELAEHVKTHNVDNDCEYCDLCKRNYNKFHYFSEHVFTHLKKKRNKVNFSKYSCHCGKLFASERSLEKHKPLHNGLKPHSCVECGKEFAMKSYLKDHMKLHSGGINCSDCGKSLPNEKKLAQHQSNSSDGKEQHPCNRCGKVFRWRMCLCNHLKWHAGDDFKCEICDKPFAHKWALGRHIQRVHTVTIHPCEKCGRKFNTLHRFKTHTCFIKVNQTGNDVDEVEMDGINDSDYIYVDINIEKNAVIDAAEPVNDITNTCDEPTITYVTQVPKDSINKNEYIAEHLDLRVQNIISNTEYMAENVGMRDENDVNDSENIAAPVECYENVTWSLLDMHSQQKSSS